MLKKELSKHFNVILQLLYELYSERLISPKLPSGALYTDEGLYPYHLQRVQAFHPGAYSSHMDFAWWYLQGKAADRHFAASVLLTNEAAFSLEGVMNCHNLQRWADENSHATRPHTAQRKFSVNLWAGIVRDCLLDPYILPERLNGSTYLHSCKRSCHKC